MSENINKAAPLIYKKMSEVMKEVGSVGKDQRNQAQGFAFRGIDQFINALYPALTSQGVFMAPRCVSQSHEIREVERGSGKKGYDKIVTLMMEYDFFAEDGSKVTIGPIPAEGLDSGDKATNKALSAGLKYALIQTFTVPTKDMEESDRDSNVLTPPPVKRDIVKEVQGKPNVAPASTSKQSTSTSIVSSSTTPVAVATSSIPNNTVAVPAEKKTVSFKRQAAPAAVTTAPAPTPESEPEIEM